VGQEAGALIRFLSRFFFRVDLLAELRRSHLYEVEVAPAAPLR
jgi:hypothetical protein